MMICVWEDMDWGFDSVAYSFCWFLFGSMTTRVICKNLYPIRLASRGAVDHNSRSCPSGTLPADQRVIRGGRIVGLINQLQTGVAKTGSAAVLNTMEESSYSLLVTQSTRSQRESARQSTDSTNYALSNRNSVFRRGSYIILGSHRS